MDHFGEQMKGFSVCLVFLGATFLVMARYVLTPAALTFTAVDLAYTMGILLFLMGLTGWVATKARKQAMDTDAEHHFVEDTLRKAARQGEKEWKSWDKE